VKSYRVDVDHKQYTTVQAVSQIALLTDSVDIAEHIAVSNRNTRKCDQALIYRATTLRAAYTESAAQPPTKRLCQTKLKKTTRNFDGSGGVVARTAEVVYARRCIAGPILTVFPALIVHSELKSVHPGFPVAFIF